MFYRILSYLQVCDICGDPFEQFWDEDAEEWHLKDAVRINNITYHPVCYQDAEEVNCWCWLIVVEPIVAMLTDLGQHWLR